MPVNEQTINECKDICQNFVDLAAEYMPDFSRRLKVHILLHMADNLKEFGPAHLYNTERY